VKFLLDSNALIALLKGHDGFLANLTRHSPSDFSVSAIVWHELHYGAHKGSRTQHSLVRMQALSFEVVGFDREDAEASGQVRAHLAAAGSPIGPYDVLIAGQALARGLTLVTHDMREFQRVPGLRVEDWE
jgi:tRNA(fMet)-specific endonuclease VapC